MLESSENLSNRRKMEEIGGAEWDRTAGLLVESEVCQRDAGRDRLSTQTPNVALLSLKMAVGFLPHAQFARKNFPPICSLRDFHLLLLAWSTASPPGGG
jgi:hypothetical protein